jgi:hypothetical protein
MVAKFLVLTGLLSFAHAQEYVETPLHVQDHHLLDHFSTTIGSLSTGLLFNKPLGNSQGPAIYLFQGGNIVSNTELQSNAPYCQVGVTGVLPEGKIMPLLGMFTTNAVGYHVDISSNPDRPLITRTEQNRIQVFGSPSPMGDLSEFLGERGGILRVPPNTVIELEWTDDNVFTSPEMTMECFNVTNCATVGEFRAIMGEHITFLPNEQFPVNVDTWQRDQIEAAPKECKERAEMRRVVEQANVELFTNQSQELVRTLTNAVNNNEITKEQAAQRLVDELVRSLQGAVSQ